MKNILKIIYSSNILLKYKELTNEKIIFFKNANMSDNEINIDEIKIFENCLKDIIKPYKNLYNFFLVFDKEFYYLKLKINFANIKEIIEEGKIIPQRAKFFDILKKYKDMISVNFFNTLDNLIIKDEFEIEKRFRKMRNQKQGNIIDNNCVLYNDIFFDLEKNSISLKNNNLKYINDFCNGGIIMEENEYGKYLSDSELPLNSILDSRNDNFNDLNLDNFINKYKKIFPNLICVSNSRLEYWKNQLINKRILIINNISIFKKLYYKNIFEYDYVIVSINFLNNTNYKNKLEDYKIFNDLCELSLINSRKDLLRNKNILWQKEPLLHLFFWNNIVIDFVFEDLKKNTNNVLFSSFYGLKKWVIFNNYKEKTSQSNFIFNIFNKNINIKNLKDFVINNKLFNPRLNIRIEKILLNFNENEKKGYEDYTNSLKDIYSKNDMKFEEDNYLQKYCSYPQRQIKINKIVKNLENTDKFLKMKDEYKNILKDRLNDNKITCEICLSEIESNNLGVTECGHLFCFSCIYKNIKYSDKCPICRNKISLEKIFYLTDKSNQIIINADILSELGTKNSHLLFLLGNLSRVLILSNFDECLNKLNKLFLELNINSKITKEEGYSFSDEKIIFLSNYDENFFNLKNKLNIDDIICLEPYYYLKKNIKFYDIINSTNSKNLKFLIIKDTIEENILKIHQESNLILIK